MLARPGKPSRLIAVDYEVLPHVTDVDAAMQASAPLLHETMFTEGVDPKPTQPSNIAKRTQYGHGDIEAGFKQADIVVERSFKTEQTHQGYIEPHACVASVNSDGTCEMWVCTQGHFVYRQQCAELLGIDISKLRVTSSEIGGGFGGKTHIWAEPIALALSRKAGRPVKLVMSREEVFRASGPTSATSIEVKIGAKKDGTITAASATLRYSCGPYVGPWAEPRRDDLVCVLRPEARENGRLRGAGQSAQDGGLSRAIRADGRLRGGKRHR